MKHPSLKIKLATAGLVSILIVLSGFSLFLYLSASQHLLRLALDGLQGQAQLISSEISQKLAADPKINLDSLAQVQSLALAKRVTIIDSLGRALGDSEADASGLKDMDNHLGRPEIAMARQTGLGHALRHSQTLKRETLYFAAPIRSGKTLWGYCRIAGPWAGLINYQKQLLAGAITGLALSAALLWLLVSLAWRPEIEAIKDIELAARRLYSGDLNARAPLTKGSRETALAAQTLNQLAQSWEDTITDLSEQKSNLAAVLEGMGEGVITLDQRQTIKMINPAASEMFGLDAGQTTGRLLLEAIRSPIMEQLIKEGREWIELEREKKYYIIRIAAITDQGGPKGWVLVASDITRLKMLERVRQDFVANVSHELKTPLSAITGFSEALLDGAMDDRDQLADFLGRIHAQSLRMSKLVKDLLELSAIESGNYAINKIPSPAGLLLERAVENLKMQIAEKGHLVQTDDKTGQTLVPMDPEKMASALGNLLDNAVKFAPPNSRIELSAEIRKKDLILSVSDNGSGISRENLPRLFERFYRVDQARSRDLGGTGLGLAIVKHIAEFHQGSAGAESVLEQGSRFWIKIPIA
ncbi:PAS domain S-box protein [candidate division TA06 bacterium]|uniref:histidine kinase n=1 Tax=candidate division TA06 bacterium TaxID=2250710 RepID=A0A933ML42_UNCT6|nr:PAS domain S-box protein [candidate division TA06 bacterium]